MLFEVMTVRANILSLVVIAALAWTTSAIDAWAGNEGTHHNHASPVAATPSEHPVSCHAHSRTGNPVQHNENSPTPAQSNYKCCLTGHDAAIVQSLHSQQPSAHRSRLASQVQLAPAAYPLAPARACTVPSADPPNITALRI
jgi:hypothetical protein